MSNAQAADSRPLDDVMLAMDVVDTLRHNEKLVARELDGEARDQKLLQRLREIYAAQGMDVPEHVLIEGVQALKEQRFTYEPPEPSFGRTLATIYVKRGVWGRPVLIGLAALVILWVGYYFAIERPREQKIAQEAVELAETLPQELQDLRQQISQTSKDDNATALAGRIINKAVAALQDKDIVQARTARDELKNLQQRLSQSYDLRVISRPGEQSGIWRVPEANPNAQNYYLIVEALDDNGQRVAVPITSEEDGTTKVVEKWALRVDPRVFDAVRRDKADDGIIQNSRLGVKRPGRLEPDYVVDMPGGMIYEW